MRKVLVADLFCGAGGSSTGARQAVEMLGRKMVLTCVNHWDRAIETHKRMHPEARHYCQDVSAARPMECVPEGRLDLLMASPTCTHHSRARGGRPTSDQQRMDPWQVNTWLAQLRVKRLLIENVPEFVEWGPVDTRTGKPVKSRKGEYFRAWLASLAALGFRHEWRILNCADYGDATTRKRFFLLARSDGKPIEWPAPTHGKDGAADLFGKRAKWRGARECIDWSLPGRSIFGRKIALAPRTIQRCYAGALRYNWPEPYLVILRRHMSARSIDLPMPTIAAGGRHVGLATPILLGQHGERRLRHADQPVSTITAISRIGLVEPFLFANRTNNVPKDLDGPMPTNTTTTGGGIVLVEPFVLSQASGGAPRSVKEPLPTIVSASSGTALIAPYYGSGSGETCKTVEQPLDSITTKDRFSLICPVTHGGGGNRAHDLDRPFPTLTTSKGGHLAFITSSYGERDGQLPRTHDLEMPMPTVTAQGSVRLAEGIEVDGRFYDIHFRMLHWRELARAMSFSDAESDYEFAGNKTEITKQIGNAVPVRTARALVAASFHDLAGE